MYFWKSAYASRHCLRVQRHLLLPDGEVRGAAVFLHGLGDHGARHLRHLRTFSDHGVAVLAIDLPGHGRSAGQRGSLGSIEQVCDLVDENFAYLEARGIAAAGCPLGLLGHSMGGFLALNYIAARRRELDFAWLSSALADARGKVPPALRFVVRAWGRITPRFAVASRIRSEMCKRDPVRIAETAADRLIHRTITAGLAGELLAASETLADRLAGAHADMDVLFTHGGADQICDPAAARHLFDVLPARRKRFALFEGLLHEPFNDLGAEVFEATLGRWVRHRFGDAPGQKERPAWSAGRLLGGVNRSEMVA